MHTDSGNSSSSSDSSSSESSDDESDSHDEEHVAVHVSKDMEIDQSGSNTLYSTPRDTEPVVKEKYMQDIEKPVSSYKQELNPVRDKFHRPSRPHSRSPANITVKPDKERTKPKSYPSLWVKIRSAAADSGISKGRKVPSSDSSKPSLGNTNPSTKDRPLVSVGSETEQPIRRTKEVEVMLLMRNVGVQQFHNLSFISSGGCCFTVRLECGE